MSKSERTRQFIVEQAAPVFNKKGYSGTSLQDLTEATGLTKGSIYGNFRDKDEVALAAFDHNFGLIVNFIRGKMAGRTSSIDKLLVYPEVYRNFLKLDFLKGGCPLLNTSMEADDTHPDLRAKALAAWRMWKLSLENHVKSGIERREIKPQVKAEEFVAVFMSLIEGAVMQAKLTGKDAELKATMNFLEQMIRGLKK